MIGIYCPSSIPTLCTLVNSIRITYFFDAETLADLILTSFNVKCIDIKMASNE